jgi:hypothetical protein
MKVQFRDDEGIKKVEALLLMIAVVMIPLGVSVLKDNIGSADMVAWAEGLGMLIVGIVCGVLYLYIEKAIPPKEEKVEEKDDEDVKPLDTKTPEEVDKKEGEKPK